jgi:hypothetical protein
MSVVVVVVVVVVQNQMLVAIAMTTIEIAAQNILTILRLNLLSIVTAVTPMIVLQGKRRPVTIPNQVPIIVVTVVILKTREVTTANHLMIK